MMRGVKIPKEIEHDRPKDLTCFGLEAPFSKRKMAAPRFRLIMKNCVRLEPLASSKP